MGMRIGYARVSRAGQKLDVQLDKLENCDRVYFEKASGTVPEGISLADFDFSADDEILSCPQGQKPQRIKTGKQGGKIVHFNKADCDHCPRQSECPVKRVKHSATLRYDAKSLRLSRRRAHEKTAAFVEIYRFRAGAEGTMSDLDRITDIKQLRVRGMAQVRLSAILKATGLNILRATAFRNRHRGPKKENEGSVPSLKALFIAVKEHFKHLCNGLQIKFKLCLPAQLQIGRLTPQTA